MRWWSDVTHWYWREWIRGSKNCSGKLVRTRSKILPCLCVTSWVMLESCLMQQRCQIRFSNWCLEDWNHQQLRLGNPRLWWWSSCPLKTQNSKAQERKSYFSNTAMTLLSYMTTPPKRDKGTKSFAKYKSHTTKINVENMSGVKGPISISLICYCFSHSSTCSW